MCCLCFPKYHKTKWEELTLWYQDIAAAIDEEDVMKFTDVVKEFDSMTPLVNFAEPRWAGILTSPNLTHHWISILLCLLAKNQIPFLFILFCETKTTLYTYPRMKSMMIIVIANSLSWNFRFWYIGACVHRILGRQHFSWEWRRSWRPGNWRKMISLKEPYFFLSHYWWALPLLMAIAGTTVVWSDEFVFTGSDVGLY